MCHILSKILRPTIRLSISMFEVPSFEDKKRRINFTIKMKKKNIEKEKNISTSGERGCSK